MAGAERHRTPPFSCFGPHVALGFPHPRKVGVQPEVACPLHVGGAEQGVGTSGPGPVPSPCQGFSEECVSSW